MKKVLFILFITIIFFYLGACKEVDPSENEDSTKEEVTTDDPGIVSEFFNLNNKVIIDIEISDSELALIQKDYEEYSSFGSKSPIYRKCNLRIQINNSEYYYKEVGIRMKGNTSRRDFYSKRDGIYYLIHYKLSFSETFDDSEYYKEPKVWDETERDLRKNRTFGGMEKLDLKWNKNFDKTFVREIYCYDLFRERGLFAPHATIGNINITNKGEMKSLGLYTIIESVDKSFIERYLPEGDQGGDLYKVGWGTNGQGTILGGTLGINTINGIGIEDEDSGYFPIYDLKTNKKTSNASSLQNLIKTVNNSDALNTVVDMDYFIEFMAVNYIVGNPDDMRYHYNNYYLYFRGSDNMAIFIPYDYDRTFGITKDWNPSHTAMIGIDMYSNYTTELGSQSNPLINKSICYDGLYIEDFRIKLLQIYSSSFFTIDKFEEYYRLGRDNYQNLVKPTIENIDYLYTDFDFEESDSYLETTSNYTVSKYFDGIKKYINNHIDR